jgi:hypothetical protein
MRITLHKGMVSIDGEDIDYGNIRNMYESGNGIGLQLSERLEHKRGEVIDLCSSIAEKLYELQDMVEA